MRIWRILPLVFALAATVDRAHGQSEAEKLFADAQSLYDAAEFGRALPLFEQALAASKSPNARLYTARCLRELGRTAEAYEAMRTTFREADERARREPHYAQTRDAAAAELALLERRIARLAIAFDGDATGATVTIDGAALPPERWGQPLPLTPGRVRVSVRAPGRAPIERTVELPAGEITTVALALRADATTVPAPTPPPPAPTAERDGSGAVRIAGIVVAGLGAAGIGIGVGLDVAAGAKYDDLDATCATTGCPEPGRSDEIAAGRSLEVGSRISLALGGAAIAGGTLMAVLGGSSAPEPDGAVVAGAAGGAVLGWRARF